MRKSERLRVLEIELVKLQYQVNLLHDIVSTLLESNLNIETNLDAGKWYRRNPDSSH